MHSTTLDASKLICTADQMGMRVRERERFPGSGLARKFWQKIMIIDRVHER